MKMVGIKAKRWTETQYSNRKDTARRIPTIGSIDFLYCVIDFCCWWRIRGIISLHQKQ